MIEVLSNTIFNLLRADRAWYLCSILVVASTLVIGVYDLYLPTPKVQMQNPETLPERPSGNFTGNNFKPISGYTDGSQWDFFGAPVQPSTEIDIEALPESALDLKLIGTFTSDTKFSSAVISISKGESRRFFLQQPILDGVTLHTIHEKQVVVNRGSILETLKLYDFAASEPGTNPNRPAYNQSAIEPLANTASNRVSGSDYRNTVAKQRKDRKERRARYMASRNTPESGAPTRANK